MSEETAVALFLFQHELGRVQMDEKANHRDDKHHHERECIQVEGDPRSEARDCHPQPERLHISMAVGRGADERGSHQDGHER